MSIVTQAPRRLASLGPAGRRSAVVALVMAVLLTAGAGAWAYWTTIGSGTGSASTGTLNAPTDVSAASSQGSGSVQVTWTAPGSGATPQGYYVARTRRSDGTTAAACGSSATALVGGPCTDTTVPDGTYTYNVTAVYRSWTATSGPSGSVTVVNAVPTATSLSSSANPSVVGQTVTYTATVTASSGTAKPTGSVSFEDAGLPVTCSNAGGQTLNASGVATCQVTYVAAGNHAIKATYGAATGFAGSSSGTLDQSVGKAATSTAVSSLPASPVSGQQVTYTATVSVTSPGAGTPTGSVAFTDGTTTLCANKPVDGSGKATCSATYAGVSSHQIVASYSGDDAFQTSTSSQLNQSVQAAATSISLISNANPAVTGQTVTLTATVAVTSPGAGTPTGLVTFKNGSSTLACSGGSQTLNSSGVATCATSFSATGSPYPLTAVYAGEANFTGSTSNTVGQAVNKANTSTTVSSSKSTTVNGETLTLTATVGIAGTGAGARTGSVSFSDGPTQLTCAGGTQTPDANGVATCQVALAGAGNHNLTAVYGGDNNFNGSTSVAVTQVVNKAATQVAMISSKNPVKSGQAVTYTATVTTVAPGSGTPSGTVTFNEGTSAICSAVTLDSRGAATCTVSSGYAGPSSHTITVTYSGSSDYSAPVSPTTLTQKVTNAAVVGVGLVEVTVNGTAVPPTCTGSGNSRTCSISASSKDSLFSFRPAFVSSFTPITAVVYATDNANVSYSGQSTGTATIAGSTSAAGSAITWQQSGNGSGTFTLTWTDDYATTYTTTVNMK